MSEAEALLRQFAQLWRSAFPSLPSRIRVALHLSVALEEKMEAVVDGRLSELVEETGALGFAPPPRLRLNAKGPYCPELGHSI